MEPYRDDPPTPTHSTPPTTSHSQPPTYYHHPQPYTDSPPLTPGPHGSDDENIPLAHFLQHPAAYPADAPPSYNVAIRQTATYRDTLVQYIPPPPHYLHHNQRQASRYAQFMRGQIVIDVDEETGLAGERDEDDEDMRYSVEKIVAMFVTAGLLLVLSGVLGWLAFGSGLFS